MHAHRGCQVRKRPWHHQQIGKVVRREGLEGGSGNERSGRKRAQAPRVVQVGAKLAFQVDR